MAFKALVTQLASIKIEQIKPTEGGKNAMECPFKQEIRDAPSLHKNITANIPD